MTLAEMVAEFHTAMGVEKGRDRATIELRLRLIAEELLEVADACGCDLEIDSWGDYVHVGHNGRTFKPGSAHQELADLAYVVQGTAEQLSIDLDRATAEVHRANMSKLGPDGKPLRRDDGKVLKGPNYQPPDMSWAR